MRIQGLDFLRGIAIIGVLFRHSHLPADNLLVKSGWAGVDLFFVLSGFLVSRILFLEFQKTGKVNGGRFLLRRGLKIYPTFYLFLALSLPYWIFVWKAAAPLPNILAEVFFLQSYLPPLWGHTWSLAVEEHFYFALILVSWLAYKLGFLGKKQFMLPLLIGFWALAFYLRWDFVYTNKAAGAEMFIFFKSHLRMEGLIVGVVFSYVYHFFQVLPEWIRKYRLVLLPIGIACALPPFLLVGGTYWISAYGYSLMYIGFASLLAVGITTRFDRFSALPVMGWAFRLVCFIGLHSYAIYVWHLFSRALADRSGLEMAGMESYYFAGSLILGLIASIVIEKPVLTLRDRWFPRPATLES